MALEDGSNCVFHSKSANYREGTQVHTPLLDSIPEGQHTFIRTSIYDECSVSAGFW